MSLHNLSSNQSHHSTTSQVTNQAVLFLQILQHILITSFANSFEKGEGERLIGGVPAPDQDSSDNVISVFINRVIDPDNPFGTSDAVRILLLQFSSLLVEQASAHIHAVDRRLIMFASL